MKDTDLYTEHIYFVLLYGQLSESNLPSHPLQFYSLSPLYPIAMACFCFRRYLTDK